MCLSRVDRIYKGKSRRVYKGYKVFGVYDELLYSCMCGNDKSLPRNEWLNEKDYRENPKKEQLLDTNGASLQYPTGWHVYAPSENFMYYRDIYPYLNLRETIVECRGLLAKGYEDGRQVWVFKFIKILEDL